MPSAPSRKYLGIRAPLHPLQLRCASSLYSPGTPSLARLAGAAHRRPRCVKLFARRYTRIGLVPRPLPAPPLPTCYCPGLPASAANAFSITSSTVIVSKHIGFPLGDGSHSSKNFCLHGLHGNRL